MNRVRCCARTSFTAGFASLVVLLGVAANPEPARAGDAIELSAGQGVIELGPAGSANEMQYKMSLQNGKSASIKTSYTVKRVSVGDPNVLEVVVLGGREIQLVSKHVGTTNLLIWDAKGRPQAVIDVDVSTAHSQLGRALRESFSNDSIEVSSVGNAIVLKGSVRSVIELEQVMALATGMYSEKDGPKIVNLLQVGGNHQVMLKVVVAEMSRTVTREFGMNVAALIETGSGTVSVGSFVQQIAGPVTALNGPVGSSFFSNMAELFLGFSGFGSLELLEVFLDVLDERGLSKILAKPTLVARSGESASFLVGGEIPIPVPQDLSTVTIEFKSFGVGLEFTPTVLGPDRIHLKVNPEVSRPDFTFGVVVGNRLVPGFITRRAATSVELGDGQSFMIAGLLSDEVRELAGKYPVLGDIPILGSLFRSTQFLKQETELVIIVTPTLVKPLGPGPHPLPTDSFIEPSDAEFYLLGALEGDSRMPWTTADETDTHGMIGDNGYRMSATIDGETE